MQALVYENRLQQNNLYNNEAGKYLNRVDDSCSHCAETYEPNKHSNLLLSSINRSFNELVHLQNFQPGNRRIFLIIHELKRYYNVKVVSCTGM